MKKRVSINLVTSKAQPSLKPKQLQFPNAFTHSIPNQNQDQNKDNIQESLQNNQFFSSAKSQRFASLYSYQAENEIRTQPKSSQQILDRANVINNEKGSPINQQNLQMVNQHLISHFQKIQKQTSSNGIYNNYIYYKERIDKALSRTAENMSRYTQSISQRKREFKDSKLSVQRSFTQSIKQTDLNKKGETIPQNPLNKLRKNRFSLDEHHHHIRGYSQSYSEDHTLKQKVPFKKIENLKTFDELSKNSLNSTSQIQESLGQQMKHESELQKQLKEKDEIIKNLQNQNNRLETDYNELLLQSQKDQMALKQLNVQLQKNIVEIKELQKFKLENQESKNLEAQINALLIENRNIFQQKQELEQIFKQLLLENEKFSLIEKQTHIKNKGLKSDQLEEISTADAYGVIKKSRKNLQPIYSHDVSLENKFSSFDLSRSSFPNKTSQDISTIQDSWISASFQTYSRQTPADDGPLNVSLNLQLLNQFNDTDIILQERKNDKRSQKKEKSFGQNKNTQQKVQQLSVQCSKLKQTQTRKKFGIKDKENKLPN